MDINNTRDNLNTLFQEIVSTSVNDTNISQIETFLINIIDGKDYEIFSDLTFINLIFLLDSSTQTTFLLKHLINEIKQKSLRLLYTNGGSQEECCDKKEFPVFDNLPSYPPVGQTSRAKRAYEDGDDLVVETYIIDHTGKALELVSIERQEHNEQFDALNDSILERALKSIPEQLSSNVPLTEDDL